MSYYVKGPVTAVSFERRGPSKKTGKMFDVHNVTVNGTVIEVGFRQPYKVGDTVELDVAYEYKTYRKTDAPANPANPPIPNSVVGSGSASVVGGAVSFPIPTADGRQTAIIRQNALTNAVAIIASLPDDIELTKVPEDDDKKIVSEAKARAELAIEIAYKFASFSSGNLDVELLTAQVKAPEAE
jgi:hypothetical protein